MLNRPILVWITCVALSNIVLPANADAADRPNVVLIMTDDQGYGDLSITGNESIETPAMDQLATEGAWFKQFYVSPVCTPTRANLMTGRWNYRTRAIDTYLGRAVLEPEEVTVAEVLSDAGYATGIFGKWHLGDYFPTRTIDQGFQESIVHQGGGLRQPSNPPEGERYHDPILFYNGQPRRYEGYCTDIFFDEAIDYIEEQSKTDEPFFVYLPTNAPHGPFDEPPSRELMEKFEAKFPNDKKKRKAAFYAMIKNVDNNIGRLLSRLDDLGIEENTIVIFLTDNGPSAGSAGPFRGNKGSVYEGGIRTVCFMRWPGVIVPGSSVAKTAAHIDLMPTILDLCRVKHPANVDLDGRSLTSLMNFAEISSPTTWEDRHLFLQWHRGDVPQKFHSFAAIGPQGRWKLLSSQKPSRGKKNSSPALELYDLKNDIGEKMNVAGEYPEIVSRLKQQYNAWFDDVSTTRDPNFGMPPIVVGAEEQPTVILTPQDKRVDGDDTGGWRALGSWPVDIRQAGPYTIKVLLTDEVAERTSVLLKVIVDGGKLEKRLSIPRGVDSVAIGEIALPTGHGRIVARVDGDPVRGLDVYQVTIK